MQWFRMYSEFATDPKIQSMHETLQRRFVIVLCLKCDGCLSQLSDEEVACAMRIGVDEIKDTKELFIKKGFIDENWNVLNWDKRQYKSDTSAKRTRKWRDRQKKSVIASQERHRDVTVTSPDTDTDTDTDINNTPIPPKGEKIEYTESFLKWWEHYPKKVGKDAAFKKWKKIGKSGNASADELIQAIITQVQSGHFRGSNGDEFIPNPLTWLNQGRWKDEIKSQPTGGPRQPIFDPNNQFAD